MSYLRRKSDGLQFSNSLSCSGIKLDHTKVNAARAGRPKTINLSRMEKKVGIITIRLGDFGISRSGMYCCYLVPTSVA